ncbi:MAG: Wzz/FepE/Etk N-terminal domain-containing protein [Clostridia bacterium]|nr:Wzz/FepE/Etk N-terminal domain-containing protein [Clostridia bacterium]
MNNFYHKKVENENSGNAGYDLRYLVYVLLKRWWIILTFVSAITVSAVIYTNYLVKPVYASSSMLFVYMNNSEASTLYSQVNAGAQLVKDVEILLKSGPVIEQTISLLGKQKDLTAQKLTKNISTSIQKDTRILKINVKDNDPVRASLLANTLTDVLVERFEGIMDSKNSNNGELLSIVENAKPDLNPVSPNKPLIVIASVLLGMVSGMVTVMLLEFLDNAVKTSDEVEFYTGCTVLAVIPVFLKD